MGPSNLATCIAPSFFDSELPNAKHTSDLQKHAQIQSSLKEITTVFTPLISFMIIKHEEIFGKDILEMFVKFDCEPSPCIRLDDGGISKQEDDGGMEDDEEEDMDVGEEDMDGEEDDEDYHHHQHHHQDLNRVIMRRHPPRSNSGTDSDSMHSVLSMPDASECLDFHAKYLLINVKDACTYLFKEYSNFESIFLM